MNIISTDIYDIFLNKVSVLPITFTKNYGKRLVDGGAVVLPLLILVEVPYQYAMLCVVRFFENYPRVKYLKL